MSKLSVAMKLGAMLCAFCFASAAHAEAGLIDLRSGLPKLASTVSGPVRGYESQGVNTFLGVPFAAPPVGPLRWRPPQAPESWKTIRDAGAFGNSCVQTATQGVFAKRSESEDCLFLNVFTPAGDRKHLPVMVWIHGGGLVSGRSDDYDARKLARDGGVVVVTFNYRLNVFGFFAHKAIDSEGHLSANYGVLDQQFVLKWVNQNIEAFGGDPQNVTLFGESGGGAAVLFNLISPGSAALFHRAIIQSGVSRPAQIAMGKAQESAEKFAATAGCIDQTADCLRSLSVQQIIERVPIATESAARVVDGNILPEQVQDALRNGHFHRVPMLIGNNSDEFTWFQGMAELANGSPLKTEDYRKALSPWYSQAAAAKIMSAYPLSADQSVGEKVSALQTAEYLVCPSLMAAEAISKFVPIYLYEFRDRSAPFYFEPVSFAYGAAHTLELQYLFPMFHGALGNRKELNEDQRKLSADMISYWTSFAKNADPNSDTPYWPRFTSERKQIQLLMLPQSKTGTIEGDERNCKFWNQL